MNSRKNLTQKIAILALAFIGVFSVLGASAADDDIVICEPQEQVIGVCEPDTCIEADCDERCTSGPLELTVSLRSFLCGESALSEKATPINDEPINTEGPRLSGVVHFKIMPWERPDHWDIPIRASFGQQTNFIYRVPLVYPPCRSCGAGGDAYDLIDGMRFRVGLGNARGGSFGGYLEISSRTEPDVAITTPSALMLKGGREFDVVYDPSTGELRQIMAPECLAWIRPLNSYSYTISLYSPESVAPDLDTKGWYAIKSGRTASTVYTISNPDGSQKFDHLRIARDTGGQETVNTFTWDGEAGFPVQWGLAEGDGLREIRFFTEPHGTGTNTTQIVTGPSGTTNSVVRRTFVTLGDRQVATASVEDPAGAALTTSYGYVEDPADTNNFGKLNLQVSPNGSWTATSYHPDGVMSERRSGWLDAGTNAAAEAVQTTAYDYAPFLVDAAAYLYPDNGATDPGTPRVETVIAAGVPVAKILRVIYTDTMGYKSVEEVRLADPSATNHAAAYADPANPRTVRTYMPKSDDSLWSERPETVRHPDGRTENYAYVLGDYAPGDADAPGSFTENPFGTSLRVTLTHGTTNAPDGIAYRTTREVAFETLVGRTLQSETHLYDGSAYERVAWRKNTLNDLGQIVATHSSNGTVTETDWGCCGPAFGTAADGTTTTTTYDTLQRPILSDRDGEDHNIYTETAYDAAGRTTYRRTFAGDLAQSTTNVYDLTGRLTWSRGPDGIETAYSYGSNATTTIRGGLTNLSVRFADGRAHYSEQNGLRQQTYAYGVNPDGSQWTTVFSGPDGTDSLVWSKTVSDPLGRTIAQTRPAFPSGAGVPPALLVTSNSYDTVGHLVKTERRVSGVESRLLDVTLYTYDVLGQPLLSCQDLDFDGEIDLSGPDRVSGQASRTIQLSGAYWQESASWTYPASGSSVPHTNAISRTRLTGLGGAYSANGATGILTAESVSIDHLGNQATSRTVLDRDNKTVYRLTDTPHSTVAALATTVNGMLVSSRSTSGLVTSYTYDALGRQIATQDARGSIHSRGYDALGRVAWETDPATNGTWFAYDSLGRRIAITNALGEVTHTAYDVEGRPVATWGATYPVAYEYDPFGRMTAMATLRDAQADLDITHSLFGVGYSISDLDTAGWDFTRWFYDAPTGLLTNKVYADLSAEQAGGKGTAYSYTADGKLASRTWARGVTTSYAYTNGSSLVGIDYSDATPAVTFAYDRLGRMTSAIAAGVSTNLFTYDGLDLVSETQNGVVISRATDALGRPTGFSFGPDYATQYAYDAYGRFHSVSSSVQSVSSVVEYSRLADSELLSGRSLEIGNSLLAVGYSYEAARSLITSVENSFGETVVSRYDYENDELGRRTSIARSGLAFGDLPVQDAYGYNPRSEVTSARRTPIGSQTELRGFSYDYEYDSIGNRITATEYDHENGALVSSYAANALNQYEQRSVPGYAGVRGSATNTATVTVNGNPAWRLDEYFYGGDEADNSAAAVMKELEITATHSNLYSAVTGCVFVAETPEAFAYDDDGNLTQDGRFGYTWNGENRLTKAETRDDLATSVPRVKVEYAYDHQGRRVATATATWTNDAWQTVESRAFLYDGWNVVTELTHSPTHTLTNLYTWGLDLSGTSQGAGGIGGLLAASLDGTTALYCYDANGNVGQLVAPDGELLAKYEYSPFGETIVSTGPLAKANPFRFSTKWFDDATRLGDWGYRWYSSDMGRWLSRDPISELGGPKGFLDDLDSPPEMYLNSSVRLALETWAEFDYVFCGNAPVHKYDYLGLDADCICPAGSKKGKKQNLDNFKKTDKKCTAPFGNNPSGYASFLPACLAHDTCYASCFKTKLECDKSFIKDLAKACSGVSDPKQKKSCVIWAAIYASGPIGFGDSIIAGSQSWTKLQKEACKDCCCD